MSIDVKPDIMVSSYEPPVSKEEQYYIDVLSEYVNKYIKYMNLYYKKDRFDYFIKTIAKTMVEVVFMPIIYDPYKKISECNSYLYHVEQMLNEMNMTLIYDHEQKTVKIDVIHLYNFDVPYQGNFTK